MTKERLIKLLPSLARGQQRPYWGLRFESTNIFKWMPAPMNFMEATVLEVLRHLGVVIACKVDKTGHIEWFNGHKP